MGPRIGNLEHVTDRLVGTTEDVELDPVGRLREASSSESVAWGAGMYDSRSVIYTFSFRLHE